MTVQQLRKEIAEAKKWIESFEGDIETWELEIEAIKEREASHE